MSKPLDELFSEADRQLHEIESASKQRELAKAAPEEVDRATALDFNRNSASIPSYAARHPLQVGLACLAVFGGLAISIYVSTTAATPRGPFHLVTGIVSDSSIVPSGRTHYGSVAAETIALPDGRIVTIRSDTGLLLRKGTPMIIRVYDSGAVDSDMPL